MMHDPSLNVYREYQFVDGDCSLEREVNSARNDLLRDMVLNPDYHSDTKRNGAIQPFLLTRGGEQHSYNVICRPGDELFAGDIIDAFGEKWIVIEARADATTHKTGVMYQCNKCFHFQNFTPEIIERWGYIDISGYSSSFNRNTQLQSNSEQVVIYMPYDDDTSKIYIDKRLPSHIGYDQFGQRMLFSFKITGINPVSESYNGGDHLLMLKAERFLYSQDKDNLDIEVCDYIPPVDADGNDDEDSELLSCSIIGGKTIRIGSSRVYKPSLDSLDNGIDLQWDVSGDAVDEVIRDGLNIKVKAKEDMSFIGSTISITLTPSGGSYHPSVLQVEVTGVA